MTISVPNEKLGQIRYILENFITLQKVTKRQIQSLV
jgi:hypothetical protein